jgi:hypothetical protein
LIRGLKEATMHYLVAAVLAGALVLSAANAKAGEDKASGEKAVDHPTIAVFTKNLTNPAYETFRVALPERILLPAEVIDRTNYKAWLVPVDQRSCPDWSEIVK